MSTNFQTEGCGACWKQGGEDAQLWDWHCPRLPYHLHLYSTLPLFFYVASMVGIAWAKVMFPLVGLPVHELDEMMKSNPEVLEFRKNIMMVCKVSLSSDSFWASSLLICSSGSSWSFYNSLSLSSPSSITDIVVLKTTMVHDGIQGGRWGAR